MITFAIILICLFIIFLVNFLIVESTQSKFPHKTKTENLKSTEKARQAVLILGLIMIFISTCYINIFYISETEILAKKKEKEELDKISVKKLAEANEIKRLGLTKKEIEILNQHEIDVNRLADEVQNAYS